MEIEKESGKMRMLSFANFSEAWLPGPDHTSLALGTVDYSAQALSSAVVECGIFELRVDAASWGGHKLSDNR